MDSQGREEIRDFSHKPQHVLVYLSTGIQEGLWCPISATSCHKLTSCGLKTPSPSQSCSCHQHIPGLSLDSGLPCKLLHAIQQGFMSLCKINLQPSSFGLGRTSSSSAQHTPFLGCSFHPPSGSAPQGSQVLEIYFKNTKTCKLCEE